MTRALIIGVSGQDGSYLSDLLLKKGYEVYGTSRTASGTELINLCSLKIAERVRCILLDVTDARSVFRTVQEVLPDEIYNLAGQSSVAQSFKEPEDAIKSIVNATLNLLEVIKTVNPQIRFYNAGSSECFGDTGLKAANEKTRFNPISPYAVAKATAYYLVKNYRDMYGLHASTGVLFNHESPLRPERFVTKKIVSAAARISKGSTERLTLGNLSISRDWGWAPDYVEAMWRILQTDIPDDFVIATGTSVTLEEFVCKAFGYFDCDWRSHVTHSSSLLRPMEIIYSCGDSSKARKILGWRPSMNVDDVIERMCEAASVESR